MTAEPFVAPLIERHRATLDKALQAIRTREYWSPHPEHPKAYGDGTGLGPAEGQGRLRRRCWAGPSR